MSPFYCTLSWEYQLLYCVTLTCFWNETVILLQLLPLSSILNGNNLSEKENLKGEYWIPSGWKYVLVPFFNMKKIEKRQHIIRFPYKEAKEKTIRWPDVRVQEQRWKHGFLPQRGSRLRAVKSKPNFEPWFLYHTSDLSHESQVLWQGLNSCCH